MRIHPLHCAVFFIRNAINECVVLFCFVLFCGIVLVCFVCLPVRSFGFFFFVCFFALWLFTSRCVRSFVGVYVEVCGNLCVRAGMCECFVLFFVLFLVVLP